MKDFTDGNMKNAKAMREVRVVGKANKKISWYFGENFLCTLFRDFEREPWLLGNVLKCLQKLGPV